MKSRSFCIGTKSPSCCPYCRKWHNLMKRTCHWIWTFVDGLVDQTLMFVMVDDYHLRREQHVFCLRIHLEYFQKSRECSLKCKWNNWNGLNFGRRQKGTWTRLLPRQDKSEAGLISENQPRLLEMRRQNHFLNSTALALFSLCSCADVIGVLTQKYCSTVFFSKSDVVLPGCWNVLAFAQYEFVLLNVSTWW